MGKTLAELRADINTYLDDASNTIFSANQKNLAINLAIQSAWPEIKKATRYGFTLAAGSPVYTLTALTRAPWGPQQVWVATSASSTPEFRMVRHSVYKRQDGAHWTLEFEPSFVNNRDGYRVEVHYNQQYPTLDNDSDETEVPAAYIINRALYELCSMETLKGHHTDIEAFRRKAPDFWEAAARAKRAHLVPALPDYVALRWE